MSEFRVAGTADGAFTTQTVNARAAKDIWSNPSNFGFTKVFSVSFISERAERNQRRELRYT